MAQLAYKDVEQKNEKSDSGIINIKFIQSDDKINWKDEAKTELINTLEN